MVRACREGKHGLRGAGWGAVGHSDGIRWRGVEDPPARATCDDLRRGIAGRRQRHDPASETVGASPNRAVVRQDRGTACPGRSLGRASTRRDSP